MGDSPVFLTGADPIFLTGGDPVFLTGHTLFGVQVFGVQVFGLHALGDKNVDRLGGASDDTPTKPPCQTAGGHGFTTVDSGLPLQTAQ